MPLDMPLHVDLALLFMRWDAKKIARFLEVNPRTVQRWLSDAGGEVGSIDMPENLRQKVRDQAALFRKLNFGNWLEDNVMEAKAEGLHEEVIASCLATIYMRVTGREIE